MRGSHYRGWKWAVTIIILLVAVAGGLTWVHINNYQFSKSIPYSVATPAYNRHVSMWEPLIKEKTVAELWAELNSHSVLLIRRQDQAVLLDINSGDRVYPASLSKIMTAIVALENIPNLNSRIRMPEHIYPVLQLADASLAGFLPQEEVRTLDLLYGALLPSGAEACSGLALLAAGSETQMVEMMNLKAEELGMLDSHFANINGLHDENHYSTTHDMAILLEYALGNATFREIFTTNRYTSRSTELHPEGIILQSTMFAQLNSPEWNHRGLAIMGGKTGYTRRAGLCLASLALSGEQEYILITTGAYNDENAETALPLHIMDAILIYDYYLP